MRNRILPFATMATLAMAAMSSAQFFSENFDVDPTANWTVNNGTTDSNVQFFFDYSTLGIPSAPNSGGTTRGLQMRVNQTNGIFSGVSVSPTGQSFTGDYTVLADMWLNFNGPAPLGGSGSTQIGGMGILSSGTFANFAGAADGVFFMTSTDGNSSADWRAYAPAAAASYQDTSGVYAAGNTAGVRNNTHPYYAGFGGVSAPAAQVALFPQQTGTTNVGSIGWGWHQMEIRKFGNTARWFVDGLLIATVDLSTAGTFGGNNILISMSDINATSSTDPNDFLITTIVDNVRVVPEPGTIAVLGIGFAALLRRRRKAN